MWKDSLVAPFRKRPESISAPLISSKGRPFSIATLNPVREQGDDNEQARDDPGPSSDPTTVTNKNKQMALPVSAENAASLPISVAPEGHLSKESRDIESNQPSRTGSIKSFLMEELDTAHAPAPLTAYCFMTGLVDAVSFSAVYVWCAFQTGNTIQLSIALARLFNGQHDYSFHIADQQALCSLISFIAGTTIGRIGDKIGCKTRMWMVIGTFIQTLFLMIAAITIWQSQSGSVAGQRGEPAWTDALSFVTLGFMSASMGLQGIMGKRLNTQFTTTVVLTTTWCELMTEPQLFNFRRLVGSRDHKVMGILFLFLGGFVGSALLNTIGDAGTLGIGTGLRFLVTLWWLLLPAKQAKS